MIHLPSLHARRCHVLVALLAVGVQGFPFAVAETLIVLDAPGTTLSRAEGVSGDGSVVAGWSDRPWRWTAAGGFQFLISESEYAQGTSLITKAISGDGTTIVGYGYAPNLGRRAFRWTSAGGMEYLIPLQTAVDEGAYAVSQFGTVVVGNSGGPNQYGYITNLAVRWTSGTGVTCVTPDYPAVTNYSWATGVSADGTVVVGQGIGIQPFRWTAGGGAQFLFSQDGNTRYTEGVSADGNVVYGSGVNIWAWSSATGGVSLPTWNGTGSVKPFAPLNGGLLVGTGQISDVSSLSWSAVGTLLGSRGFDLTGWQAMNATGVSADGNTIVGFGSHLENGSYYTRGFVASVPEPSAGIIALAGLACGGFSMWRRSRRRAAAA